MELYQGISDAYNLLRHLADLVIEDDDPASYKQGIKLLEAASLVREVGLSLFPEVHDE